MMDLPEQKFPDGVRVKLRDGVNPGFYEGFGLPGNEGWIRKHQTEKYGYQRVYIEWDQDHWAYNGAKDGWSWEGHFEIVEGELMSQKDDIQQLANEFKARLEAITSEPDSPESVQNFAKDAIDSSAISQIIDDNHDGETDHTFAETLEIAQDAIKDAEAFIVVGVVKKKDGGLVTLDPVAYHAAVDSRSSELCHLQMSNLAGLHYEELVTKKIFEEGDQE